jgi:hypothetical protein
VSVQVGTLKPDADPSLTAILTIHHPRDHTQYEQGSFLSQQDALLLSSMEQTADLKQVKATIEQRLALVRLQFPVSSHLPAA